MKYIKSFICFLLLYILLANNSILIYANNENLDSPADETSETETESKSEIEEIEDPLNLAAESAVLIDADTGVILYNKDCHKKLYPASITKIMTTMLAIEYGKYDDTITHSHNAVFGIGPGSSHIGMREGEQISLDLALYGIMLESANEVCMAVAEHIDGSVEKFVERMNEKAKAVGAVDTHFANPHGYHDENHYTTAYDMAQIMKAAIQYDKFIEIISTVSTSIPPTNKVDEIRYLNNKNKMVKDWSNYYYEYCVGGKTGFTDEAGNTLVTYAEKDGINLIAVVMKDKGTSTYDDSKKLYEYGFSLYENKSIFDAEAYNGSTEVIQKYKDKEISLGSIPVKAEKSLKKLVPDFIDTDNLKQDIKLPKNIQPPVKVGDKLGNIDLKYNDYIIGNVNIIASEPIEALSEETLIKMEKKENLIKNIMTFLKIAGLAAGILAVIIIGTILIKPKRKTRNKSGSRKKQKYKVKLKD